MKRNRSSKGWLGGLLTLHFTRYSSTHNDKILPETHWSAFLLVPFLLAGFTVLTFWPDDTQLLFAWSAASRMTALMLGAAYAGGAYFFSRVYLARHWHDVGLGFIPAMVFSFMGGLVTIIYWDEFNHSSIAFLVWVALYAITSWLIPLIWLRNLSQDPRMPSVRDVVLPRSFNFLWIAIAASNLIIGAVLFFAPEFAGAGWPWELTPLGARVIGSLFVMLGFTALALVSDRRWSSAQVILETLTITLILVLVGVARSWTNFNPVNPLTWIFTGTIIMMLVGICVLYLWVEIR
jgi:hypothetical protein